VRGFPVGSSALRSVEARLTAEAGIQRFSGPADRAETDVVPFRCSSFGAGGKTTAASAIADLRVFQAQIKHPRRRALRSHRPFRLGELRRQRPGLRAQLKRDRQVHGDAAADRSRCRCVLPALLTAKNDRRVTPTRSDRRPNGRHDARKTASKKRFAHAVPSISSRFSFRRKGGAAGNKPASFVDINLCIQRTCNTTNGGGGNCTRVPTANAVR
jgi:hypothetical protein